MTIDRNNNPMVANTATECQTSVFFSTPCVVKHIVVTNVSAGTSSSIKLCDMKYNVLFHSVCEPHVPMRIFEDPIVLPNGLRFHESTSMSSGLVFVHIK